MFVLSLVGGGKGVNDIGFSFPVKEVHIGPLLHPNDPDKFFIAVKISHQRLNNLILTLSDLQERLKEEEVKA